MRAVICERPGTLQLIERPEPAYPQDAVLVRIRRIGVCGTDLHIFAGSQPYLSYPRVMGHELSGTVESAPESSGLVRGDVVFIIPYLACGICNACRARKPNCCRAIEGCCHVNSVVLSNAYVAGFSCCQSDCGVPLGEGAEFVDVS